MTTVLERLSAALADRYTIEHELGAGGMATVYLAPTGLAVYLDSGGGTRSEPKRGEDEQARPRGGRSTLF